MASENVSDKFSIKNILFTKAIPNYVPPAPPYPSYTERIYSCIDCGDKYHLESSYEYHISRKSLKISYMCRHCNTPKVFYNRCNLLAHIRSHAFKMATINVSDLKVEPLLQANDRATFQAAKKEGRKILNPFIRDVSRRKSIGGLFCHDCHARISNLSQTDESDQNSKNNADRAYHYKIVDKEKKSSLSCPICLYNLPNLCSFNAHMRIHIQRPPYFCPDCGDTINASAITYPYSHHCDSFKAMRRSMRQKCPGIQCERLFHPSEIIVHVLTNHTRKLYKCPECVPIYYNVGEISKHVKTHGSKSYVTLWQCFICPFKPVLQMQVENHLVNHIGGYVYTCWACGNYYKDVNHLLAHKSTECKKNCEISLPKTVSKSPFYRVVKRCFQCKQSFTYKCKLDEIDKLSEECPNGCNPGDKALSLAELESTDGKGNQIICHICKNKINEDWQDIKKHFAMNHKQLKCLDLVLKIDKLPLTKYSLKKGFNFKSLIAKRQKKKRSQTLRVMKTSVIDRNKIPENMESLVKENYICPKCQEPCESKLLLETHLAKHRDPCTAYQCLECGACYVVKPSFSTHLLLEHGITDVDNYVKEKQCFNEQALARFRDTSDIKEPLETNQCSICREQFQNHDDYEKHFRTHGMAFLLKTTAKKSP